MIAGFRDEWLRAFFLDDRSSRHVPADIDRVLFRKLQMIDDANTDSDLRVSPSNHFEKLRGNLAGALDTSEQTVAFDLSLGCSDRRGQRSISR